MYWSAFVYIIFAFPWVGECKSVKNVLAENQNNNSTIHNETVYDMDLTDNQITTLLENDDDYESDYYYENSFDDYVYPRHSEALVYRNKTNFRWPNGTIPYDFQSGFNDTYKKRIEIAIQNINANLKCCIIFR